MLKIRDFFRTRNSAGVPQHSANPARDILRPRPLRPHTGHIRAHGRQNIRQARMEEGMNYSFSVEKSSKLTLKSLLNKTDIGLILAIFARQNIWQARMEEY